MTKKKVTTPNAAEGSEVTAERLRAFLANPDVKENVKGRVRKLVGELYEAGGWDTLPEEPELYALEFQQTYINDHLARGQLKARAAEIIADVRGFDADTRRAVYVALANMNFAETNPQAATKYTDAGLLRTRVTRGDAEGREGHPHV